MVETPLSPAPRIPLQVDIEYRRSYARQPQVGILKNISLTGAFLVHNGADLKKDDKVTITFSVSGRVRKINAHVVWCNERGSGLRFQPFNNQDVQIVDDFMYFVKDNRDSRRDVLDQILKRVA
jgi:hypothetical protein